MPEIILTTKNKKYKLIKSLLQKKSRTSERLFTVEGIKSVMDAVSSDFTIKYIVMSESFSKDNSSFASGDSDVLIVKDEIYGGLCDTSTPQGVMAVVMMKENPLAVYINPSKLYIYCDNINDPGNLGTIIRTADAAGFGGVFLSPGCVDLYSPKTVRSSMGSFFNIETISNFGYDALFELKKQGFNLYCGALSKDSRVYTDIDFKEPSVIVVGNEANGVSDDILNHCEHIIIPMYGRAESLNVGVASAVLMYEAVRQRGENN